MGWLVHKIMSLFQRLLHWCTDDYALSLRATITVQRDSSMANKSTDKSPEFQLLLLDLARFAMERVPAREYYSFSSNVTQVCKR